MRLHVPHVRLGGRSMATTIEAVRVSTFAIWGGRSTFAFVEVCTIFHRLFTILFLFSLSREELELASWLPSLFVCLSPFCSVRLVASEEIAYGISGSVRTSGGRSDALQLRPAAILCDAFASKIRV